MKNTDKASLLVMAFALLVVPCLAFSRDQGADLVAISTRFVTIYSSGPHKAGDPDGQFIEDVVIPAVNDAISSSSERLSTAQLSATIDFIVASDPLASEEVSEIAARVYKSQRVEMCTSIAKIAKRKSAIVIDRIKSGLVAAGDLGARVICP